MNRVDWDLKIKVADFGLARALQEDKDYYRMNPKGASIPIRWCALESLVDGLFYGAISGSKIVNMY